MHIAERPQEPAGKINQVHPLIDQFAAAGPDGIGSPLAVVAESSAVAVASADEHQRAERARIDQRRAPAGAPDDNDG